MVSGMTARRAASAGDVSFREAKVLMARMRTTRGDRCRRRRGRGRGFSLLESLLAVCVLGVVVGAVISAVATSHKLAFEGQKRLLAAMAVDDLMIELVTLSYPDLKAKDGAEEKPGQMKTLDQAGYPASFWSIGRTITVKEEVLKDQALGTEIKGLRVTVSAGDGSATLAEAETFVPEPAP